MDKPKLYTMTFARVYPLYIAKVERKGRTRAELDAVIFWLTGYDAASMQQQIDDEVDLEAFVTEAPQINANASKIKGVICGIRVEEIDDAVTQRIRWMDKLVDELAKGKALDKVLRSGG